MLSSADPRLNKLTALAGMGNCLHLNCQLPENFTQTLCSSFFCRWGDMALGFPLQV